MFDLIVRVFWALVLGGIGLFVIVAVSSAIETWRKGRR